MEEKRFKFGPVFLQDGLLWRDGPDAYEYIGTRQYFEEIEESCLSIKDYVVDSIEENNASESFSFILLVKLFLVVPILKTSKVSCG